MPSISQLFQGVTSGPLPIAQYYNIVFTLSCVFAILSLAALQCFTLVGRKPVMTSLSGVRFADCLLQASPQYQYQTLLFPTSVRGCKKAERST